MNYTKTPAEIETAILAMLDAKDIRRTIQFIGDACPPFCEDTGKPGIGTFPRKSHIHGQNYRMTLELGTVPRLKCVAVDFWNSYHDAELKAIGCDCQRRGIRARWQKCTKHPKPVVTFADVLSCAQLSDPGTFDDFCSDFGYDNDSRKVESVWRACQIQYQLFRGMFTADELETLQNIVSDF